MKTLIALALVAATGCGAIMNDDNSTVTISGSEDLKILVDGMVTLPGRVELSNRRPHVITAFDKEGNMVGSCQIDTTVMARYIVGDFFLGGLIPGLIDGLTGSWYRLDKTACAF